MTTFKLKGKMYATQLCEKVLEDDRSKCNKCVFSDKWDLCNAAPSCTKGDMSVIFKETKK